MSKAPPANPKASIPGIPWNDPAALLKWGKALGNLKATGARPRIVYIGDSKTMGAGAGSGGLFLTGAAGKSKTKWLADILSARGYAVNVENWFGANGLTTMADIAAYDSRRGFSGAAVVPSLTTMGGLMLKIPSTATDTISFSPNGTVDTVEVTYVRATGLGTFSIKDGAADLAGSPVSTSASTAIIRASFPLASRGSGKAINLARTTGGDVYTLGMSAYDSQTPSIELVNCGYYGSQTSNWLANSSVWDPLKTIVSYAADLYVVNLGTNDLSHAVTAATYAANMQSIITACKASGDVILVMPSATTDSTWGSDATRAEYLAALKGLAIANNCILINEEALLGGRALATSLGLFSDSIHESAAAYHILARTHARLLTN